MSLLLRQHTFRKCDCQVNEPKSSAEKQKKLSKCNSEPMTEFLEAAMIASQTAGIVPSSQTRINSVRGQQQEHQTVM